MKFPNSVKMTNFFMPTLREDPKDAEVLSHKYMLKAGMIRQESSGIYSWLPLGYRILMKISDIISDEQGKIGACEMLMPTIQSSDIWKKSGRYDDYGKEMLRIMDRGDRELLYGPTNEEMITDIVTNFTKSYKDLPILAFQIQWKFRDEIRPRFGVMRGREFLMKDGYGFDIDPEASRKTYNKIMISYLKIFKRLGVQAIPVKADTGPIGGDLSHEFIILAKSGESEIFCDKRILDLDINKFEVNDDNLQSVVDNWFEYYAATDEMYDETEFNKVEEKEKQITRGIEVGHIFYFGTKYSDSFGLKVDMPDGSTKPVHMGSYGIGVSRVIAGIIEANFDDEKGLIFSKEVTPFQVGIVNMKQGLEKVDTICENIFQSLDSAKIECVYDDREKPAGVKFSDMELMGLRYLIVVGPKGVDAGEFEIRDRLSGEVKSISINGISNFDWGMYIV